jgi:hypothetical protein
LKIPNNCSFESKSSFADFVQYLTSNSNEDRLDLDIPFKGLEKLKSDRSEALKIGILDQPSKVNATLRFKQGQHPISLRLKGDLLDHLDKMPWSVRVEMKNGHFNGMKNFSLQRPSTRNNLVEPIFMNEARALGLLAPRYGFVRLFINGEDMGLVAYEEHMGKELLEFNQRKEAPIFRFDDSGIWKFKIDNKDIAFDVDIPYQNMFIAPAIYYHKKKIDKDESQSARARYGIGILEDLQWRRKPLSDIFEIDKLYLALVLSDAWRTTHPISWPNIKFYMNPYTLKLEPILFDNGHIPEISTKSFNLNNIYSALANELGPSLNNKLLKKSVMAILEIDDKWYEKNINYLKLRAPAGFQDCFIFNYSKVIANKKIMIDNVRYFAFEKMIINDLSFDELMKYKNAHIISTLRQL